MSYSLARKIAQKKYYDMNKEDISQQKREYYQRNKSRIRAVNSEYQKSDAGKVRQAEYFQNNIVHRRDKLNAYQKVQRALKAGKLKKGKCFCGEINVHAHHEDYSKPLEVEWLCPQHHADKHRRI